MSYRTVIDTAHNVAFVEHTSESEYGFDRLPHWELQFHTGYVRWMNVLRDVRQIPFPKEEAERLRDHSLFMSHRLQVQKFDIAHGESRVVNVAQPGAARDSIELYFLSLLPSPIKRAVFEEMPSALAWLGLPADYVIKFPDVPADHAANDHDDNVVPLNARTWLGLPKEFDVPARQDQSDDDSDKDG